MVSVRAVQQSECRLAGSFGRRPSRATSLLSPQLIRETFCARRAMRIAPVGFFGGLARGSGSPRLPTPS